MIPPLKRFSRCAALLVSLLTFGAFSLPFGVLSPARADEANAPQKIVQAVDRAVPLLQKSMAEYPHHNTCFSCHHQGVPLFTLALLRKRGYTIDEAGMATAVQHTIADLRTGLASYNQGTGQPGGVTRAGYALLALQAGGVKPEEITSAVTGYLLQMDKDRGFWKAASNRPPSEVSNFTNTFLAIYGLKNYADKSQAQTVQERIGQARKWLEATPTQETEDKVFRLWGMAEAGSEKAEIAQAVKALLADQNADGGWAQLPQGASDAYATASVLTILQIAGGLPTTDAAYQRGLTYLLKTQLPDGSWHVVSRSRPVQPYFESGFPHGRDQFISMSATAWSVAALALATPANASKTVAHVTASSH